MLEALVEALEADMANTARQLPKGRLLRCRKSMNHGGLTLRFDLASVDLICASLTEFLWRLSAICPRRQLFLRQLTRFHALTWFIEPKINTQV